MCDVGDDKSKRTFTKKFFGQPVRKNKGKIDTSSEKEKESVEARLMSSPMTAAGGRDR